MRVRLSLILLGVLGLSLPPAIVAAQTASPAVLEAAAQGSVRVLVRLQTPAVPEGRLSGPAAVSAQRSRIAMAQDQVSAAIGRVTAMRRFHSIPWIALDVTPAELGALLQSPAVAEIHRDRLMRPATADSVPFIGAPLFWQVGYKASGWTVAVLDSGVDAAHPAIGGRVLHEACFSSNVTEDAAASLCAGGAATAVGPGTAAPCASSITGCDHGTAIAGIVAGFAAGYSGVAPAASLISIQIYSRVADFAFCQGHSPCVGTYTSDQVAALEHVLDLTGPDNAARIAAVNMSLSSFELYDHQCDADPVDGLAAFKAAADNLRAIGIPTVVAAGNDGAPNAIGAPACLSTVISVGATLAAQDAVAGLSNRAPFLSVMAPGIDVTSPIPGGGYRLFSGTSMSAAFVSGGWALLRQFLPNASVTDLLAALQGTGAAIQDQSPPYGIYRRIRLVDAALSANGGHLPIPPGAPRDVTALVGGANVALSWSPPMTGNGPARYVVSAGSQPGIANLGQWDVGTSLSIGALVGPGTYYVRVRGENVGGPGPDSADEVIVIEPPPPPTMLAETHTGNSVTLTWQPPPGSPPATGYRLEAGTAPGLANVLVYDTPTATPGLTVGGVPAATYYVRVRAKSARGISPPSNEIIVVVP